MLRADQVPAQIEQVLHSGMSTNESLSLPYRFELPGCRTTHPSLPYPGILVRLLSAIIRIPVCHMNRLRNQFPMSNSIAAQLVCHYLPGIAAMPAQ
jgi:hypothetical protein